MIVTLAFYYGCGGDWRAVMVDQAIRAVTRSRYSHVEMIAGKASTGALHWCISASPRDGGVRAKRIYLRPDHWDLVHVRADPVRARAAIMTHAGAPYDLVGALASPLRLPFPVGPRDWLFCSEIVAATLRLPEPWAYSPGRLAAVMGCAPATAPVQFRRG